MDQKSKLLTTSSIARKTNCLSVYRVAKLKIMIRRWRVRIEKKRPWINEDRYNLIKEWIYTQKNYIRDLKIIIYNIMTPMHEKAILTKQQIKKVFANIQSIVKLSQKLLEELIRIKIRWNPESFMISHQLSTFCQFIKLYSEYYNNYHEGQNILKEVRHLEDVQQIQKALAMDFQSYLYKLIQRPPLYELLLRRYCQCTPVNHPDYKGIQKIIQNYAKVNSENNQILDKKQKTIRLVALARMYPDLVKPHRQLLKEFSASSFFVPTIKINLLTDIILITRQQNLKEVLESIIELDGSKSFVQIKNCKYSTDYTILVGGFNSSAHLNFSTKNLMLTAYEAIKNVISELADKDKNKIFTKKFSSKKEDTKTTSAGFTMQSKNISFCPSIKAICIGVQKRAVSIISNQTYYILKLSISEQVNLCQHIYIRFSQIQELRQSLSKAFPTIVFPEIYPNITRYKQISIYVSIDSTNLVAYRMLCIAQFLNFVFRCQRVMMNPLSILNILKIEEKLWEYSLVKQPENCECDLCFTSNSSITIRQLMHERYCYIKNCSALSKKQFCLSKQIKNRRQIINSPVSQFSTLEERLMYLDCYQGRIDYNMIYRKTTSVLQKTIKVSLMSIEHQHMEIKINEISTVGQVISAICKNFRLYSYQDFGLFVQYQSQMRLLDSDQYMFQIIKEHQLEQNKGFIQKMRNPFKTLKNWSKDIIKYKCPKIYFGKYLFFDYEIEKSACERSTIRYQLVIQQIFYQIHKKQLTMGPSELKRVAALYLYLRLEDQISILNKSNFPNNLVNSLVSSQVATSKWISEVINIIDTEKKNILDRPNFSMVIYDRILQIVHNKIGWKTMFFPVVQYSQNKSLCVGINCEGIVVLQKGTKEIILSIPIRYLRYKITPFSLFIEFNQLQCRFDGKLIYNFGKVAEKYQILYQNFKKEPQKIDDQCS